MANTVLAGDYSGLISFKGDKKGLLITENKFFGAKKTFINKTTVDHYELVMQEGNSSMGSGVARGAVGAALFGGIGAIAGANSAKKNSDYTVSIIFKDRTISTSVPWPSRCFILRSPSGSASIASEPIGWICRLATKSSWSAVM